MAHPRLILRAAERRRGGPPALSKQDLSVPALDWVDDGMAPAVVNPDDVLPWLTHEARVATLGGRLVIEDPRPVFPAFFARVIEGGGTHSLREHLLALADARRLAADAARVRDAVISARHRAARPGEALYEPFSSRWYASCETLAAAAVGTEDPAPFAFGLREARWPGLTVGEVEDYWRESARTDVAGLIESSLPPASGRRGGVRDVQALGDFLARTGGREGAERFLASWNARQEVSGIVPDRSEVLWVDPAADRESCEAWCRRRVSLHGAIIASMNGSWPRAGRD